MDCSKLQENLVYIISSSTARLIQQEKKKITKAGQWWHMPLILALGRQRKADRYEFEDSLVYRVSSRTGSIAEKFCLKKLKNKAKNQKLNTIRGLGCNSVGRELA